MKAKIAVYKIAKNKSEEYNIIFEHPVALMCHL
jgi:hypothetical protein